MNRLKVTGLAVAALVFGAIQAQASPIRGVVSGTTTMGEAYPLAHAFDQSGLSGTYINGVTDFGTFTAATTHDSQAGNDWVSSTVAGSATFNLGSLQTVDGLAFWNFGGLGGSLAYGITQFSLVASVDAAFTTPLALGTFNPTVYSTLNPAQIFSFGATTAQYFRLEGFVSNGAGAIGIGEIAFRDAAVPEPASMILLGSGLGALALRRRRAKS